MGPGAPAVLGGHRPAAGRRRLGAGPAVVDADVVGDPSRSRHRQRRSSRPDAGAAPWQPSTTSPSSTPCRPCSPTCSTPGTPARYPGCGWPSSPVPRCPRALRVRAARLGVRVVEYYGAAELSFVAVDADGTGLRAFPGVELRVREGVVEVRSPYVALGYAHGSGPLTVVDGWAGVGDRGRLRADGVLVLDGRGDHALSVGGTTVLVGDVERVLGGVDGVLEVACLGEPHRPAGRTARGGGPARARRRPRTLVTELRAVARRDLPPAARPVRYAVVDVLPGPTAARPTARGCAASSRGLGDRGRSRTLASVEATDPRTPVVVAARRSAVTTAGRGLARFDAAALAAPVLAAVRRDVAVADGTARVDDVLLGNCCGPGGDVGAGRGAGRGPGHDVPGVTVDRQCGSGLEALRLAAALVRAGDAELVLAGGTESADATPGTAAATGRLRPAGPPGPGHGRRRGGARGQGRHRARAAGRLRGAIPPARRGGRGRRSLRRRARRRGRLPPGRPAARPARRRGPGPHARRLRARTGRSRPATPAGSTTERPRSPSSPRPCRAAAGLPGLRLLSAAVVGVDPALPGLGPVPAIRAVLGRGSVPLHRIDVVEITEAFAAQVLACTDALGLDPLGADADRVCPDGGAIALGHPVGRVRRAARRPAVLPARPPRGSAATAWRPAPWAAGRASRSSSRRSRAVIELDGCQPPLRGADRPRRHRPRPRRAQDRHRRRQRVRQVDARPSAQRARRADVGPGDGRRSGHPQERCRASAAGSASSSPTRTRRSSCRRSPRTSRSRCAGPGCRGPRSPNASRRRWSASGSPAMPTTRRTCSPAGRSSCSR